MLEDGAPARLGERDQRARRGDQREHPAAEREPLAATGDRGAELLPDRVSLLSPLALVLSNTIGNVPSEVQPLIGEASGSPQAAAQTCSRGSSDAAARSEAQPSGAWAQANEPCSANPHQTFGITRRAAHARRR